MTRWLPEGFAYPMQVVLATGHHMRPISVDDIDLDCPAVMGSQERLWTIFGEAWGWPAHRGSGGSSLQFTDPAPRRTQSACV